VPARAGFLVNRAVLNQMMRISAHIDGLPQQLETAFRWSVRDQQAADDAVATVEIADVRRAIG